LGWEKDNLSQSLFDRFVREAASYRGACERDSETARV
jgi:hypothetical protein